MGKYLKEFELISQYEEYINSDMAILPNVSIINDINGIYYNAIHDYSQDYLTFVAEEDGTFKLRGNDINYSIDGGDTWTTLPSNIDSPTIKAGNKIMFKATLTPTTSSGIGAFLSTGKFTAQGNVMSLLYGDDFIGQKDLTGKRYTFYHLFDNCRYLTNVKNLSLPATTLVDNCYSNMFYNCTSLINAPELPATTLTESCYGNMFEGCTSLINAPELPATTLAFNCYTNMFVNCTSLINAPELPATTLAYGCYQHMFYYCTSLINAPELPATTLSTSCYSHMFYNCTSLINAPELPATTLANNCYTSMFYGCTSLINAPELPATTLVNNCYQEMFFICPKLNYIKMLATDISAYRCLYMWMTSVSSTGTFVKHPNMTSLPTGDSGIPEGWTVQDAA